MSDWWEDVERELDARADHAPDPWGSLADDPGPTELTPEQIAFLAQVATSAAALLDADDLALESTTADGVPGEHDEHES